MVCRKPLFPYTTPVPAKIWCSYPWRLSRSVMLGSTKSKHPRLTNREIIFWRFPTCVMTLPQHYRQMDGQTDGRLAVAIPCSALLPAVINTKLCEP